MKGFNDCVGSLEHSVMPQVRRFNELEVEGTASPIPVLAHFHVVLEPGGYLVFDYIRSDATGLDTASSLRDRIPALTFLRERFDIVEGEVPLDGANVEAVVARQR